MLLLAIAAGIGVMLSMAGDFGTYASFKDVMSMPNREHQIVGHLASDKDLVYDPAKDPNYFSFFLKDEHGIEKQVVYKGAKPQDFERSEQIVLTGKMESDYFLAKSILLKCPSKYKDEQTSFSSN